MRRTVLISHIHHTNEYPPFCYVGNITVLQIGMGLFQDSDFARDLEDSKSTSSHAFVPISWMCKKQTSVSHSAEIISLVANLRMDGIPALTLWDLVIEVFHSVPNICTQERATEKPVGSCQAKHA